MTIDHDADFEYIATLRDEIAALKAQVHGAIMLHAALRAENERLRKALEWAAISIKEPNL